MTKYLLTNQNVQKAFFSIAVRSEQQTNEKILLDSFCDAGLLTYIDNVNHQIIQGRRGTGKTHILRVFNYMLQSRANTVGIYVDCRTLGSASSIADISLDLNYRCRQLFKDIIFATIGQLCNLINEKGTINSASEFAQLQICFDDIYRSITEPKRTIKRETTTIEDGKHLDNMCESGGSVKIALNEMIGGIKRKKIEQEESNTLKKIEKEVTFSDGVSFPDISSNLNMIASISRVKIFIILDEWSSLPMDVQPYFAEFLKRGFMACPNLIVKIATIENRTNLKGYYKQQRLGLEMGSDISIGINLDTSFVFDNDCAHVISYMYNLLFKHLESVLSLKYICEQLGEDISNDRQIINNIFSDYKAFIFLVKAAEGNSRDFFNILSRCIKKTTEERTTQINVQTVLKASKDWFEQDKYIAVNIGSQYLFDKIVCKVVAQENTRGFFIEKRLLEKSLLLLDLIDARVLHYLEKSSNALQESGQKFSVITIDFGACAEFILLNNNVKLFLNDRYEQLCAVSKEKNARPDYEYQRYTDDRLIRKILITEEDLDI